MHGMGVYDERNKLSLKMCGMHGSYVANMALQNSDCIINIGARFDDRTTGDVNLYAPIAKDNNNIIHCNIEKNDINKTINCDYPVITDANFFINYLFKTLKYKDRDSWINKINNWKSIHPFEYIEDELHIKTQTVLKYFNKIIKDKDNYIFTFGVGNHLMMGCQYIDWQKSNSIIASGSLGAMGTSLGYAIGAKNSK